MRHTAGGLLRSRVRRRLPLAVSAVMVATLLQAAGVQPSTAAVSNLPGLPKAEKPVEGSKGAKVKPRKRNSGTRTPQRAPKADLPSAGAVTITVPDGQTKGTKRFAVPRGQSIGIGPARDSATPEGHGVNSTRTPNTVTAQVLSREQAERVGVKGSLFTLDSKSSALGGARESIALTVDYAPYAELFGGSFASRMRLVELPACALTTPDKKGCREARPVAAINSTAEHTLTAKSVSLRPSRPTVLAVTASAAGDKGDYKATPLAPSSTWKTNLNTGDFIWSYGIPTPDVAGGLKPTVGLSYTSGAIDGRTGGTNNQGSWVGDGFDLWPGHIERRYKPCADDGVKNADGSKPGDMCWAYDNALISFNGASGELVPTGKDEFRLKNDDGTRIKRLESTDRGNGDNDGEYWRLTAPDGITYYFGYNRLPGWTAGKATTDSTWTMPVYGNNAGEKCHAATFADSWCQQAWRWNLDYAVDAHGNTISYHYKKETNSYGRNLKSEDDTPYTRGGYLERIDYGQKSTDLYATKPLAQVVFSNAERCLPTTDVTCAADTIDTKAFYWYDTPWDLNCKAGTSCDNNRLSPSFWTRKRLTGIATQVLKSDGTYGKVDSWAFNHRWGMADTDYQLLLDSIQHTGESAAPAITLPKTTFAYEQLANRLDKTGDGFAPFIKSRLSSVADEYGGELSANYSAADCNWSSLPTPETNTTRCFPQYIGGSDSDPAERHWFNKYVTTSVTATDRIGGSPDQVTRYDYLGGAAWHFDDDDGLTKEKEKTWSQWRGYGQVRVRTGGQGGDAAMKTQQDSYFLRGMDGDRKNATGGTKTVSVSLAEGEGDPIPDHESAAGFVYKSVQFDQPGGKVLNKSVSRPWHHETAKKVRDWGTVTANFTGTSSVKGWDSLDNGAGAKWRTTSSAFTHDTVAGRVTQIDDFGNDATPADDRCTRTTYPEVTDANLIHLFSRKETVTKSCAAQTDRSKDVLSDVRTAYDGGAYGAAPVKGDPTAMAKLKSHDGSKATYVESGITYDGYGRQVKTTDLVADVVVTGTGSPVRTVRADGRTTTTTYVPATGLVTEIKVTTPPADSTDATTAQTTVTTVDPLRGTAVKETDTNGNVSELTYDALGRSMKVWLPDRRNTQVPNQEFAYTVTDATVAVATKTLNNKGGQITSYALYDGFQRERQTQSPGPDGGSVITDVFYDERGLPAKTFEPYYTTGKPSSVLFKPADALSVETQTRTTFDGLNRAVETRQIAGNGDGGQVLNTTRTIYGGDRTTVIPPVGGTATTTVKDVRGNITELQQHHSRSADAPFDTTSYVYTPRDELEKVTGPGGMSWSYEYDQLGRQIKVNDPDKGTTSSSYDDRGQLTFSKGSRTDVPGLTYLYDGLGRQTEVREGSATGTLRTKQVYDTITGAKGQLAESTRYVDGNAYTTKVTAYDRLYRAIKTAVVIPVAEGNLQGTYQSGTAYLPSGLPSTVSYSAAGSLPGGSSNYTYEDETLRRIGVFGEGMTSSTVYSLTGKPLQYTMGLTTGGKITQVTNTYEWGTQRLATSRVDRQDQPGVDRHVTYRYDEAGYVRSMTDVSRSGTDNQCFINDYLGRLTEAWTQPTTTCAEQPVSSQIGGPAPYWQSFAYDKSGNRVTEVQHDTSGNVTQDIKRSYNYPGPGKPLAHSLTSITTATASGTTTDAYAYDPSGNTTSRPGQALSWDAEGHLASVTEDGKTTTYVYDAAGNRLIKRTDTEATLYLGHTEVTLPTGATKSKATRYFDLGGGQMAVRADDGTFSFTIADHHGTGELAVSASDLALTQRRTLPFGGIRGQNPAAWPGTRGFVGGTDDTKDTGLTHLGAREYDPNLGRFISVDPVFDMTDPQQMNGYTYAKNTPVTSSDPSGLWIPEGMHDNHGVDSGGGSNKPAENRDKARKYVAGTAKPVRHRVGTSYVKATTNDYVQAVDALLKNPQTKNIFKPASHNFEFNDSCRIGSAGCNKIPWDGTVQVVVLDFLCKQKGVECGPVQSFGEQLSEAFGFAVQYGDGPRFVGPIGPRLKLKKSGSGCKCFPAGTRVEMADGAPKKIEEIELGDKVLATDPETGKTGARKVTRLIVTDDDKQFNELSIATGDGVEKLTATHEHPFWSPSEADWIEAGRLKPGMTLRSDDGHTVIVTANRSFTRHARTYNLTVDDLHTYYVLAGETPVLVHNANCPWTSVRKYDGDGHPVDGTRTPTNDALDSAEKWLGSGYKETVPGSGRYVSRDGTRVARMGESDITGQHGGGPHMNFERLAPNPKKPGKMMVVENRHIYLE